MRQWQAEKAGVETQRPKPEAILQAEARIGAGIAPATRSRGRSSQSKSSLEQAKRDRQRSQQLHADGATPRQEIEQIILI